MKNFVIGNIVSCTIGAFLGFWYAKLDPSQLPAAEHERAAITAHCEKWDLAQAENRKYDSHSGARREGCRTAFLAHSPYPEHQSDAAKRLAAAVADRSEAGYHAQRKIRELRYGLNPN